MAAADMELVVLAAVPYTELVVVWVERRRTNHPHMNRLSATEPAVLVAVLPMVCRVVLQAKPTMPLRRRSARKLLCNSMLLMLRVSSKIRTHKSFVGRLRVACKPTRNTSKFDSSNRLPSHLQAHSSSKKCAHPSRLSRPRFASVNRLPLFPNLPHSFSANGHHQCRLRLPRKRSFAVWPLYPFHRDRSSSSVCRLSHPDRVILSSNVGFHMELKPNVAQLCNALLLLNNMLVHAM
jgi:hypothetical protein